MATYDVVIAGGGHNGLIVAAYLAKAGVNVCVVEHHPFVGGGVITQELNVPGFKYDTCATWHGFIQSNPLIRNDELELQSKFGLKYIHPKYQTGVIFEDETCFMFYPDLDRTCASIATFSEHDAEAYRRFHDWSVTSLDMLVEGMFAPPPSLGTMVTMLEQSDIGKSLLRGLMVSILDVVDEWFENEKIKIALSRFATEMMLHPGHAGTALLLYIFVPLMHKYGAAVPQGGSGQLSESLARCIEHHGGTIRLSSTIKNFKIAAGECTGVVLESGEEILAKKAVVTNFHIKQIFPGMVGDTPLPDGFQNNVDLLKHSDFMPMNQHIALKEAPKFKVGGDIDKAFWVETAHSNREEYLRAFDDICYGHPRSDLYISMIATHDDPSRAPEGNHTQYLYCFNPYVLADGGPERWDEIGQEIADGVLENLRGITTNMGDENILGRTIMTPLDYGRTKPSQLSADFNHLGMFFWQNSGQRPLPGYHQYRMPIDKLYLCGPSAHPGGGCVGGGRAPVQVVMEDLGIDFEKVIS